MPCSGNSGTWTISWNRTVSSFSSNQSDDVSGYADDSPYLADSAGIRSLVSACDGRNMSTWCFSSSGCYIVSAVFTPSQAPLEYDCINGACLPKTTYNTPGLYPTLEECEVSCGAGCSGKCISNSDWAKIEGLSSQLKNKNCS